ncbi:MAG: tRNA pseudouridine synthase A [Desulfurivibrio sp.]|nr:tRNA pseudouridine synthase A [Desulfurivibrio sp.]
MNVKLTIAFDGTSFAGWQRQRRLPTIQAALEDGLARLLGEAVVVHGAGRTDAGVHAAGMVANFRASRRLPLAAYHHGLNSMLPPAIRILAAEEAAPDFHARFSARGKIYVYGFTTAAIMPPCRRLYTAHFPGSFNPGSVVEALPRLLGEHDFTTFEAAGSRWRPGEGGAPEGRGGVRRLFHLSLHRGSEAVLPAAALRAASTAAGLIAAATPSSEVGQPAGGEESDDPAGLALGPGDEPPAGDNYYLVVAGDGFLRHMVRNLAGTLLEIGRDKRTPESLPQLLADRDRSRAGPTAPAHGLTLWRVLYDGF